jgi:hypothetical protein
MGEEGVKPKIERGANRGKPQQQQWAQRCVGTKEKFKAPTQGLESKIFKTGDAANAASFHNVKKELAKYAGVHFTTGNSMARAAIDELKAPNIRKPNNPPAFSNPPTVDEEVAREEWKHDLEDYRKQKRAWDDARPRAFQLVMSRVDPDVEEKLTTSSRWDAINDDQDVIELLKLIRAFAHKHDEIKQGTMAIVEHDLQLYLGFQKSGEDNPTYAKNFKARCDAIDTFGGRAGFHQGLYTQHCQAIADAAIALQLISSQMPRRRRLSTHLARSTRRLYLFVSPTKASSQT